MDDTFDNGERSKAYYALFAGRAKRIQDINPGTLDADLKKRKVCLIEDIFKTEKLLYGLGKPDHEMWIKEPGKLFDHLYACDIYTLEQLQQSLCNEATQEMTRQIGNLPT